jgi:hypothetical protein
MWVFSNGGEGREGVVRVVRDPPDRDAGRDALLGG